MYWNNYGLGPILVPLEVHWQQGAVECRTGVWDYAFVNMANAVPRHGQLTDVDDPHIWTAKLKHAMNSRVREGGFTPYQFIFGRDSSIPTSLLQEPLREQNAAAHNEHAR